MSKTFSATDFKGVKNIELSPEGNLVVIAGGNGAGKSSFIDSITELFDPRGARLTPRPIREGATEARAEYVDEDLNLRVSRVWKKNGTAGTLSVEALDGAKYSRPSEIVAGLLGGAIFDPVAFLNLDDKKQREALLAKVDLPFDLDEVDRQKAGAEGRRLEAGRDVKRLEGALSQMSAPAPGTPDAEVSAQAILDEIEQANQEARSYDRARDSNEQLGSAAAQIEREINDLQVKLEAARAAHKKAFDAFRALPQPTPVEPLREKLNAVDETNKAVRAAQAYAETESALEKARALHAKEQEALDRIEATKRDGLAAAKFPVDGLSVDDDGVTYQGVPFVQVNSAHRMRVAFGVATAGDPKLRLVIVRNGDLLDSDSLDALRAVAEERGYIALVERDRDESREIGFVIREGVLVGEAL